ncbi:MAG TPA: alpha/beta hydrolase [Dehalococcoidia bacterium]
MAQFQRGDVSIYYEVHGGGFPFLLIAPGGMRSTVGFWDRMAFNPIKEFAGEYQVIAMDQRNAGQSTGPLGEGWRSYAEDQAALLEHLGVDRFHVMGGCIGCSYALGLIERTGNRCAAAVLQNPIGLQDNRDVFYGMVREWAKELRDKRPEIAERETEALTQNMFSGEFVFTVDAAFVKACRTPMLVLPGDDNFHPTATAREIAALAPDAECLELGWREPDTVGGTVERIRSFLKQHTP